MPAMVNRGQGLGLKGHSPFSNTLFRHSDSVRFLCYNSPTL
jgi:hypothetical protein